MVVTNTLNLNGVTVVGKPSKPVTNAMVVSALNKLHQEYSTSRQAIQEIWKDAYASYIVTPEAKAESVGRARAILGDVDVNWRHRLSTAKPLEIVETIVAYMMSALFPNKNYFNLSPTEPIPYPEWRLMVLSVKMYMRLLLKDAKFKSATELLLRDLCITGIGCMSFPWLEDNVSFTVLSPFEYWVDPHSQHINDAGFMRLLRLTKPEVIAKINEGVFNLGHVRDFTENIMPYNADTEWTWQMMGIQPNYDTQRKTTDVFEYYGDLYLEEAEVLLKNIKTIWTGKSLLSLEANPYEHGKPFMLVNYISLLSTPYGMGSLQSVLPQLIQQNVIMSRRADNLSIAGDTMFEIIDDGVVDIDQVYTAPGHKIIVGRPGTINPITPPVDINPSITEEGVLEQRIDKAAGTGPYIGIGAGRSAERVTAEEVNAQRDAGGNRLNLIYMHIEEQWFHSLLTRFYYYMKTFAKGATMRLPRGNEYMYVRVTKQLLQWPMSVEVLGAGYLADRELAVRSVLEWLNTVSQFEPMMQRVNMEAVLDYLSARMLPDDVEMFINAEPPQQPGVPSMVDEAAAVGGQRLAENVQQQLATGTAQQSLDQYAANLGVAGDVTAT